MLEQFRTNVPMVLQAGDAAGNPIPNLPITWTITGGSGTISAADARTDANGLATAYFVATTLDPGLSFSLATITASSTAGATNFLITTAYGRNGAPIPLVQVLAPDQADRNLAGKAGSTIPGGFKVQVVALAGAQQGFPIPNVSMRIVDSTNPDGPTPAICAGRPLSDSQGYATCDLVLTGTPGTYLISAAVGEFLITPNAYLKIEPGTTCTFAISPASALAPSTGGTGTVNVTAGANCGWTAASSVPWLTITSGASGTANGAVTYSVSPNNGTTRVGTIAVAGQTFTVTQAAFGSGGALVITTGATLPTAVAGSNYAIAIAANGGRQPYTFSAPGALPPGLALNPTTGALTGVPAAIGNYSFAVNVTDAAGQVATQAFSLNVVISSPGFNPSILNTSFPNGAVGTAYSQILNASGGCLSPFSAPPVFTVTQGSLPPGLTLQASASGNTTISGVPTTNGSSSFTLTVTDGCGRSGTANFNITIGSGGPPPTGVNLTPNPAQLQFNIGLGSTVPVTQQVTVTSNVLSQFTAYTQMTSAASLNWLAVTPVTSSTPAVLNVTVAPGSLPAGTFTGYIQLVPANNQGAPVNLPVTLRITPPPAFSVVPSNLFFLYQQGTAPGGNQTLAVNSSGPNFDFTVSTTTESGVNWLFASPSVATTPATVTVSVNPLGLPGGMHRGTIRLTPNTGGIAALSIPVTLSIPQTGPTINSVVSAASFQSGPIAPGQIITVFGSLMGPRDLALGRLNTSGLLDNSLAETRVLFDGLPAPLLYSSAGQISAIVPYQVNGRTITKVEVEYRGLRSPAVEVRVADSAPGIFTLTPAGQAAALNQDGTVNSGQAPAEAGSIIAFYATGEGPTDPPGLDGRIMGEVLAKPIQAVRVQIGGKDAEVRYAGSAPGLAAGAMQVNVRVPDGLPPNTAVPLVLTVGRVSSQPGVTIVVK